MARINALLAALALLAVASPPVSLASVNLERDLWNLDQIRAPAAWAQATGRSTVVAVVDTGLDWGHPEFGGSPSNAKIVAGASCIGAAHVGQCSTSPAAWLDRNGHGTHVAGIVAAPRDGRGVAGVAPRARVMPVRALDENLHGSPADVAVAIDYAVAHGADVINLSLTAKPGASELGRRGVLDDALTRAIGRAADAGVLVVVAAGNEGLPVCSHKVFQTGAGLCVGATDRRDVKTPYSAFGAGLNLVAPGGLTSALCSEAILGTHLRSSSSSCGGVGQGYALATGTSMAAPHVSGVGALLAEQGIRGGAAAGRIMETAVDVGAPGSDRVYGEGRVDALRAVSNATSTVWRPATL